MSDGIQVPNKKRRGYIFGAITLIVVAILLATISVFIIRISLIMINVSDFNRTTGVIEQVRIDVGNNYHAKIHLENDSRTFALCYCAENLLTRQELVEALTVGAEVTLMYVRFPSTKVLVLLFSEIYVTGIMVGETVVVDPHELAREERNDFIFTIILIGALFAVASGFGIMFILLAKRQPKTVSIEEAQQQRLLNPWLINAPEKIRKQQRKRIIPLLVWLFVFLGLPVALSVIFLSDLFIAVGVLGSTVLWFIAFIFLMQRWKKQDLVRFAEYFRFDWNSIDKEKVTDAFFTLPLGTKFKFTKEGLIYEEYILDEEVLGKLDVIKEEDIKTKEHLLRYEDLQFYFKPVYRSFGVLATIYITVDFENKELFPCKFAFELDEQLYYNLVIYNVQVPNIEIMLRSMGQLMKQNCKLFKRKKVDIFG